jgi:ABC-type antimicrobial peptide transport system permease subunit
VGVLLGGAVVVETLFALPGVGRMIVTAINQRNYRRCRWACSPSRRRSSSCLS